MHYFRLLLLASAIAAGLASSAVALYGRYRDLPGWLTGPSTCQLEAGGCQVLFRSANAALLHVPNAAFGIVFYILLIAGLCLNESTWLLWAGATGALAMSARLGYGLLKRRLQCRICWTGHIANLVIWLVVSAGLWR